MAGSGPVAQKTALNSPSYRAVLRGWAFRPSLLDAVQHLLRNDRHRKKSGTGAN